MIDNGLSKLIYKCVHIDRRIANWKSLEWTNIIIYEIILYRDQIARISFFMAPSILLLEHVFNQGLNLDKEILCSSPSTNTLHSKEVYFDLHWDALHQPMNFALSIRL